MTYHLYAVLRMRCFLKVFTTGTKSLQMGFVTEDTGLTMLQTKKILGQKFRILTLECIVLSVSKEEQSALYKISHTVQNS